MRERKVQAVVIGAGPAGLAASIEIAKAGGKVVLIDENGKPGGQLFKQIHKFFGSREHRAGVRGYDIGTQLLRETEDLGVVMITSRCSRAQRASVEPLTREPAMSSSTSTTSAMRI